MPTVLRELMRHEPIEIAIKYYVRQKAQVMAEQLSVGLGAASTDTWADTTNSRATAVVQKLQ